MFKVSVIVFIVLSIYAMNLSGVMSVFIDPPAILLVLLTSVIFMFAATSISDVKKAFSLLFNNDISQEKQVYRQAQRVFSTFGHSAFLVGLFMAIIAWIAMAAITNDVNAFGPALSIASLPLFYGLAIKIICYVAEQKVQTLAGNV